MTIDSEIDKKNTTPRTPLLLRIVSIVILVEGVLGLLFFISAGIFKLYDKEFAGSLDLGGYSSNFYSFYIILHIAIFLGFVISAIYLLKSKRIGFNLFIISYIVLAGINFYMNDTIAWASIVIGLGFLAVLMYFKKRMN